MVLVTHKLQGSQIAVPSRLSSWNKGLILNRRIAKLHVDRRFSLKHNFCLSVGAHCTGGPKERSLKISLFKGGTQQNDESGGRGSGSKVTKSSVKLAYLHKEGEDNSTGSSPKMHDVGLPYTSETDDTISGSPAIHKLFKKWLTMLRTQAPCQVVEDVVEEGTPPTEIVETQTKAEPLRQSEVRKTMLARFWSLDATIKIPLLIFGPLFLAINMMYGAEVSKELTPLWVFGPLVVALYVKMLRGLCAMYVFCYKQTAEIVKNMPAYYDYLTQGRFKDDIRAHLWQPVLDIKNMDYKEEWRKKLKQLQGWLMEKYLDYVESIWPYYCRTIRFLKRANLI